MFTPPTFAPRAASQDDRNYGMLIWGLNFFFPLIAPVIFMLIQKEPFVQETSKEVLNFAISYLAYSIIAIALIPVVIGLAAVPVVGVAFLVFSVLGLVAANNGELYRVPAIFRLIQ